MRLTTNLKKVSIAYILKHNTHEIYKEMVPRLISLLLLIGLVTVPFYYSSHIIPMWMQFFSSKIVASSLTFPVSAGVTYIIGNSIYVAIYYLEIPFFEQYKVTKKPWPWRTSARAEFFDKLKFTLPMLAFNNYVVVPCVTLIVVYVYRYEAKTTIEEMPSFLVHLLQICFMVLCEDFMSYWGHRSIHHPYLYKNIHYIHHKHNETLSFAAEICHPIEFVLLDILPLMTGPLILGKQAHFLTVAIYCVFRLTETMEGHSGYEFPWAITRFIPLSCTTEYHGFHHLTNKGNFATFFLIWDSICGTNQTYYE